MTQKTNYQRCYDSNLRLSQQMQSNQRNTQNFQAFLQRGQDSFQASQKRLDEIYQSQRNLANSGNYTYTNCDRDFRVVVWIMVKGMATILVTPVVLRTFSERIAIKVVMSIFGCFVVSLARDCCSDRSPEPSIDELIILPKIQDEKLPAEGYYDSIRSLFSRVACCASWFISQGKSEPKAKIEVKSEPAEGYCDSIRSLFSRVVC